VSDVVVLAHPAGKLAVDPAALSADVAATCSSTAAGRSLNSTRTPGRTVGLARIVHEAAAAPVVGAAGLSA